jgi:pSer/pThr/pTyr-binding forkhead associated (FHA) protein
VDLGSTNFTRVNDERVVRERELADGDAVQFARARCVFRADRRRGNDPGQPAARELD